MRAKLTNFFVRITQPARRGRVCGIASRFELPAKTAAVRTGLFYNVLGLRWFEGIRDVPKIDQPDQLIRRKLGDQSPNRLVLLLCPKVPKRIYQSREGEMDDAFLRSQPTELTVASQAAPECPHVRADVSQRTAYDQGCECPDRRNAQIISSSDGEGESVTHKLGVARMKYDIGRGIVGIRIHGIGSGQPPRSRKTNVERFYIFDCKGQDRLSSIQDSERPNEMTRPSRLVAPMQFFTARRHHSARKSWSSVPIFPPDPCQESAAEISTSTLPIPPREAVAAGRGGSFRRPQPP